LHDFDPVFEEFSYHQNIRDLVQSLQCYQNPIAVQSMYIFKQPYIGAKVGPHQDGTYLFNEPLKIMGVWVALEDATLENGCLWFIPGSHKLPIKRRYIRNPNQQEFNEGEMLIYEGKDDQFDEKAFVPVEIKAGDAILIHGQVVHKSEQNRSPISRQIYTFHIIETNNTEYSKEKWIQTKERTPVGNSRCEGESY